MARTAKITKANVGPRQNVGGAVGNTPVRAQDFNDLAGDYISSSDANAQSVASALTVTGAASLSSTLAVTGASTLTGAAQFNGGYAGARTVVDLDGSTAAPTAAQSGTIFTFDGTACTVTLPTCAAGLEYFFVVDTTQTGDAVVTTQSADKINGAVTKTTAAYNETNLSDTTSAIDAFAATTNTLTMNGTTTGGVIGTYLHVIGLKANAWHVSGVMIASGSLATSAS